MEEQKDKRDNLADTPPDAQMELRLIEVIPIARGINLETLTYFTAENVGIGSVVSVPVRRKNVAAIVVEVRSAAESRGQIRSADFEIKKVSHLHARQFFRPEFIETCSQTSDYFAASTGSVLYSMISQAMLENISKLAGNTAPDDVESDKKTAQKPEKPASTIHEKHALQAPEEERYSDYKSLIREQFARKSSVFFCLPSAHDIEIALPKLEKGIEKYTYILHGDVSEKVLLERYQKIMAEAHPVLIVATGHFLSLPRTDIRTIILEKENSRGYKIMSRPFLDIRIFAEYFSKKIGAKLVVGDIFLQTETMQRYMNGEFHELYPLKFRSLATSEGTLVDMRTNPEENSERGVQTEQIKERKKFTPISEQLASLISHNRTENERLFIFCARKGLSPTVVCADCGTIVTCTTCGNPTVLHGMPKADSSDSSNPSETNPQDSPQKNFFLCHHCGERRSADELCKLCGSWRLTTLGIGTELVQEKISELFPDQAIFIMDKEKVTTQKRAASLIKQFYDSPGSILIGTEMALLYLDQPIENSAVAGIDALFSVPDFRINEKVLAILLKMRSLSQKQFLLQTRNPDQPVFEHALRGNIMDFYRDELEQRKAFSYPPFSVLIKISIEGKRDSIAEEMARVKNLFENGKSGEFDIFPSFIKGNRGKSILHALLKVPAKEWPNESVLAKLRSLPPHFTIKVDPESLL